MRVFAALFGASVLALSALTPMTAQQSSKQIVNAGPSSPNPLSTAVKAGGFVYVSGQYGQNAKGAITGDIKAQTRRALDNIETILKAAGSSLANAANMTVYLRNAGDFAAMNETYASR